MSAKNGWNIETRMSQEKWSEHECLFEVLATMKGTSDRCKLTEVPTLDLARKKKEKK